MGSIEGIVALSMERPGEAASASAGGKHS